MTQSCVHHSKHANLAACLQSAASRFFMPTRKSPTSASLASFLLRTGAMPVRHCGSHRAVLPQSPRPTLALTTLPSPMVCAKVSRQANATDILSLHKTPMNLGIKTHCESCGNLVLGIVDSLQQVGGKYLCSACAGKLKNPNLTLCQDCGEVVSIHAASCPKCGAPQTQKAKV